MKLTKYLTIPFIAIGIVLSLVFGIEYNCQVEEMLKKECSGLSSFRLVVTESEG